MVTFRPTSGHSTAMKTQLANATNMIPPLSLDVLSSNPQFASLHKSLATKYLDHDASTKSTNISQKPAEEQANKHLTEATKDNILTDSLYELVFSDGENALPKEIRELLYVISRYSLTTPALNPTQTELLSLEVNRLNNLLPSISTVFSRNLQSQYAYLHALAKASSTNDDHEEKLSRYSLQVHLKDMICRLDTLQQITLPTATVTLINTLTVLLSLYTQHLTLQLTHLSRFTHGTSSRHTHSRTTHLSTISQALAGKIRILALEARRSTYSAQTQTALANYSRHLVLLCTQLDTRVRTMEDELRLYEGCDARGGKTMEELARRYADVLREVEEVKADVLKLREEGKGGSNRNVSRTTYEVP